MTATTPIPGAGGDDRYAGQHESGAPNISCRRDAGAWPDGRGPAPECGKHAAEKKIDVVIGVRGNGSRGGGSLHAVQVRRPSCGTPEQAGEWLARNLRPGDAVLLKGLTRRETGARAGHVAG